MLTYHRQVSQFLAKAPVQNSSVENFVKMKPPLRSNTLMCVPASKKPKKPSLLPVLAQKAVVPIFWSPGINTGNN